MSTWEILRGPSYDPEKHFAEVQRLYAAYLLNNYDECVKFTKHTLAMVYDREHPPYSLVQALYDCVERIYGEDQIYAVIPPDRAPRDYLETRQHQLTDRRISAALKALIDFLKRLPLPDSVYLLPHTGPTVEYRQLIPDYAQLVKSIISRLAVNSYDENLTFPALSHTIQRNYARVSGIGDLDNPGNRKVISPTEYKGDPTDYLEGTPLKDLFSTQVPFHIPMLTWASHGICLAPPGHGKTQLLGSLITNFLSEPNPPGLVVLDPHGDLYSNLATRVDADRLVTLNPDINPPPLNFLDFGNSTEAQTNATFSYLMSSLSGGLSDKQGAIVPYLLKLLRQIPSASLDTLRDIVDEKGIKKLSASRYYQYIQKLPHVDQGFFQHQFHSTSMQETKNAIGWKLYSALSNDTFRAMFSARTNSFDAAAAMRDRKVVLVKGSENTLGQDGATIFLQFIVAQVMQASFKRATIPEAERHLCLLIIDEAKHVFNDQTERILTECRKWNLGFLAATQLISQIPENVRTAIYGATAIKISGPVADSDAEQLRKEMYCSKEFIRSMKAKQRSHADWAFFVNQMTDHAVRVRVPYGALEALPKQRSDTVVSPSQPVVYASTGVTKTSETLPQNPEKRQLTDIQLVITTSQRLETLLKTNYGAMGTGFYQQFKSVRDRIPLHLHRPAGYVAVMRNRVAHNANFNLYDNARANFISRAKLLEDFLSQPPPQSTDDNPGPAQGRG
jgi:hypothetical protein